MEIKILIEETSGQYVIAVVKDGTRFKVEEFLQDCEKAEPLLYEDVMALLYEIAIDGPPRNKTQFKHLKDGVFEIKVENVRLYGFFDDSRQGYILLYKGGKVKHGTRQDDDIEDTKRFRRRYKHYVEQLKRGSRNEKK